MQETSSCLYLNNIINNPDQEKFRKIKQQNKAFQERVASLKFTENLINLIGFELTSIDGVNYFLYSKSDLENLRKIFDRSYRMSRP